MDLDALSIVMPLIKILTHVLRFIGIILIISGIYNFVKSCSEQNAMEQSYAMRRLVTACTVIMSASILPGILNMTTGSEMQSEIVQNVEVEPEEDIIIEEPVAVEEPVIEETTQSQEDDIWQPSSNKNYSFLFLLIPLSILGAAFAYIISIARKEKSLETENIVENTKTDYEIFMEALAQNINKMREYLKFQQLSMPIKSSLKNIILNCEKIKENTDNTEFNTGSIKDINAKYITGILMLLENYIKLKKTEDNSNDCVQTLTEIEKTICDSEITFEEIFKESIEKEILEANTNAKTFRVQASIPSTVIKSNDTQLELKF